MDNTIETCENYFEAAIDELGDDVAVHFLRMKINEFASITNEARFNNIDALTVEIKATIQEREDALIHRRNKTMYKLYYYPLAKRYWTWKKMLTVWSMI